MTAIGKTRRVLHFRKKRRGLKKKKNTDKQKQTQVLNNDRSYGKIKYDKTKKTNGTFK